MKKQATAMVVIPSATWVMRMLLGMLSQTAPTTPLRSMMRTWWCRRAMRRLRSVWQRLSVPKIDLLGRGRGRKESGQHDVRWALWMGLIWISTQP